MNRKTLFRWAGWFAFFNAFVFGLVSLRYFSAGVPADTAIAVLYLVTVYIGHHMLLTVLPLLLLAAPLILLFPSRRAVTVLGVTLFAAMIALMMLDSLLWSQSRFHINGLTLKILGWQSWVFAAFIFVVGLFFQAMLAKQAWHFVLAPKKRHGVLIGAVCALCVFTSQFIHAWADAAYYVPVTGLGQTLPVYRGVTAKKLMTRSGLVDVKESRERELARRMSRSLDESAGRLLDYPLEPMRCGKGPGYNLLMIVVDSMRGSVLTPEITPNMSRFAATSAMNFSNHFSGGNSSRMGMFSLFYALPPGYWESFAALQRSSVLVDELQARDYALGLFSSATLYRPVVLDRTAFANVPNLRIVTEPASDPAWKRDRTLTGEWFEWLDRRDPAQPFFGFLFYDAAMSMEPPPGHDDLFEASENFPMAAEFAVYQGAVNYVDTLVGEVLDDLDRRGLTDDTVVLITSDHGEEFGETAANLQKHGSGYTRHQLVTPMLLAWPGRERGVVYDHRSSHYDILPTLMQGLFACDNPASDYSVGWSLFEHRAWDWMLAGSYYNYAVLEPDQVIVTFPNGLYEVRDWEYRLVPSPRFRGDILEAVSEQNARFFAD